MRKLIISLFVAALFVFVTSVQAEYQTIKANNFAFGDGSGNGLVGRTVLDFSDVDNLDDINSFTLDLSLALDSIAHITKTSTPPSTYTLQPGTYEGNILYGIGIKTEGAAELKSLGLTESLQGSYTFDGGTIGLNEALFSNIKHNDLDITQLTFLSEDFLSYLNENKQLVLDFTFTGPVGFLNYEYTSGSSYGFDAVLLSGTVSVSGEVSSGATPEPATLLIFGVAAAVGLPVVRRIRRK